MKSSSSAAQSAEFSSPMLAQALENGDPVAVALALRNDRVIVPLLSGAEGGEGGEAQVRVFRRGDADKYMFVLFSSVDAYVTMLPEETDHRVVAYGSEELLGFLETNRGVLESVWFDVAGPHPMQASPDDIIAALTLS
jgi:hypothetical protein